LPVIADSSGPTLGYLDRRLSRKARQTGSFSGLGGGFRGFLPARAQVRHRKDSCGFGSERLAEIADEFLRLLDLFGQSHGVIAGTASATPASTARAASPTAA
jgi:hypothetical protein